MLTATLSICLCWALPALVRAQADVKLVIVAFRTPDTFLDRLDLNGSNSVLLPDGTVTPNGKRKAFSVGKAVDGRYGALFKGIEAIETSELLGYYDGSRAGKEAMKTFLNGAYPPKSWDFWHPFDQSHLEPLEAPGVLSLQPADCPEALAAYKFVLDGRTQFGRDLILRNQEVVDYAAAETGLPKTLRSMESLASLLDQPNLPAWISRPSLPGYSAARIKSTLESFRGAASRACALDSECARYAGGFLVGDILSKVNAKVGNSGALAATTIVAYVADAAVIQAAMALLGYDFAAISELKEPIIPPTAGFEIELRNPSNLGEELRFFYHYPDPRDLNFRKRVLAPRSPECAINNVKLTWCPLDRFLNDYGAKGIQDSAKACNVGSSGGSVVFNCPADREFRSCGPACPPSCAALSPVCVAGCVSGCFCKTGTVPNGTALDAPCFPVSSCFATTARPTPQPLPPAPVTAAPTPTGALSLVPASGFVVVVSQPGQGGPLSVGGGTAQCADSTPSCGFWAARGECRRNPIWMKSRCQVSCQCCGCTEELLRGQISGCSDGAAQCGSWASRGECDANPQYMRLVCRRSCGSCRRKL